MVVGGGGGVPGNLETPLATPLGVGAIWNRPGTVRDTLPNNKFIDFFKLHTSRPVTIVSASKVP